jgi:multidrug transporter EmrE-like cation transporter
MFGWLALAGAILFNTAGNLCLKRFSMTDEVQGPPSFLNPWFIAGITSFAINVFFYSRALKDIPLVAAYPLLTGSCIVLVALAAVFLFKEHFSTMHAIGYAFLFLGICFLSLGEWSP